MPPEQRRIVNGMVIEAYHFSALVTRVYVDNSSVAMTFDEAVEWAARQPAKRKNGKEKKP